MDMENEQYWWDRALGDAAETVSRWGDSHEAHIAVNARNMAAKLASAILGLQAGPQPCCQEFAACRRRCVPRADYWQSEAAAERERCARKPMTAQELDKLIEAHVGGSELADGEYSSMVMFAAAVERAHGIGA